MKQETKFAIRQVRGECVGGFSKVLILICHYFLHHPKPRSFVLPYILLIGRTSASTKILPGPLNFKLTKVLRDSDIPPCGFTIFKLRIGHFQLFSIVKLTSPRIPLQIKVEMYCIKNMSVWKTMMLCYSSSVMANILKVHIWQANDESFYGFSFHPFKHVNR